MAWDLFGRNWLTGIMCVWPYGRETIPNGWQECDGTNGTVDMRGFFPLHPPAEVPPGGTGGTAVHKHTVSGNTSFFDSEHDHDVVGDSDPPKSGSDDVTDVGGEKMEYDIHQHPIDFTSEAGGENHRHTFFDLSTFSDHIPPFRYLLWIAKIS